MHRFLSLILVCIAVVAMPLAASAATLTRSTITRATPLNIITSGMTTAASATGDECLNDGRTILRIQNDSGSNAYVATVAGQQTVNGQAVAGLTVAVGTSEDVIVGPFPELTFNNANKRIAVTYSGSAVATDLDVACYRLMP
jgi:hypothetical protein